MGWLNRTAYKCLIMIPKIWNSKLLHFLLYRKNKQKPTQFRFNYLKTIEIVHVVAVLKRYTVIYLLFEEQI